MGKDEISYTHFPLQLFLFCPNIFTKYLFLLVFNYTKLIYGVIIMKVIGITGKSGSGKSTFADILAKKLKCKHIDIDKISHEALYRPEILDILCEKFGTGILDENGTINRKKLGAIVFTDKDKMKYLSDLTWEFMQKQLDYILSQDDDTIILEYILLPHTRYWNKCDTKILVRADDVVRKNKVIQRDNISEEYFDKRDSASIDYSNVYFDYIFENDYQSQTMEKMINILSEQCVGGDDR